MSAESRREQILDVARDVVVREGFRAATIERIASACGVTRTLVYQQFGTLAALLVAMVDREHALATRGFLGAVARPPMDEHPFAAALSGVLDAVASSPSSWRMFLLPGEGGPPELHARLARARAGARAYIDRVLAAHPGDTFGATDDRELSTHVLHAVAEELVRLHLEDPVRFPKERLVAHARSTFATAGTRARVRRQIRTR